MDIILEFFKNLDWGTIAANAFVVFLFLSKPFISKVSEKTAGLVTLELEKEREEKVKSKYNTNLELLKSDLAKDNIEYQASYSQFYKDRTEVIPKLYRLLVRFLSQAREMTQLIKKEITRDELLGEFGRKVPNYREQLFDLNNFLCENQILFTKELTDDIYKFYHRVDHYLEEFYLCLKNDGKSEESIKKLNSIYESINNVERIKLEEEFTNTFRTLICPPRKSTNRPSTNLEKVEKSKSDATDV